MRAVKTFIFLMISCLLWSSACSASDIKDQTVQRLTQSYHNDGWDSLSFGFSYKTKSTVIIKQSNIIQNSPLTPGQITNALGTILKPNTVSQLKKAGFTKGEFVDGKSRKYRFVVSTKYHKEMQAFFGKLSNGR